jgi:molybdopterin/thiamine biosynthesis adenylyltransferase
VLDYEAIVQRNIGILTWEQQERLRRATVAVAGVGGVGAIAAERLARLGIGAIRIADPETYEPSNLNRQLGATTHTIGRDKAEVIGEMLRTINPSLMLTSWSEGISPENVDAFVSGADVVVDEIEHTHLDSVVALYRAAREHDQFVVTAFAIGFGATLLVGDPNGMTLEEYFGIPENANGETLRQFRVPIEKMCPRPPGYADEETSRRIRRGGPPHMPTLSVGCSLAGSLVAAEVASILLGIRKPRVVPSYTAIDLIDQWATFGHLQARGR